MYRNSLNNSFNLEIEDEIVMYKIIENISAFGLDILTDNKIALVNFIEKDVKYVVNNIPLDLKIKNALIGKENILRDILDLALAYEKIHDDKICELCDKLHIKEGVLWGLYCKAVEWCGNIGE